MRWPAIAALALSAVVAGYLGAIAVSAVFWSARLPKAGEFVGGIIVSHPTAASPEVMGILIGAGLLAILACGVLAHRLQHRLGKKLAFAMPFGLMAVSFSLAAWAGLSYPPF
jgi:hypothetical protein